MAFRAPVASVAGARTVTGRHLVLMRHDIGTCHWRALDRRFHLIRLVGRTTNEPEKRFTPGGTGITSPGAASDGWIIEAAPLCTAAWLGHIESAISGSSVVTLARRAHIIETFPSWAPPGDVGATVLLSTGPGGDEGAIYVVLVKDGGD